LNLRLEFKLLQFQRNDSIIGILKVRLELEDALCPHYKIAEATFNGTIIQPERQPPSVRYVYALPVEQDFYNFAV
jgi:hypothetical protein